MPVTKFSRPDLRLRVSAGDSGELILRLAWNDTRRAVAYPNIAFVATLSSHDAAPVVQRMLTALDLPKEFERWRDWRRGQPTARNEVSMMRITLQLDELALAALPWERYLREAIAADEPNLAVVRVSPVRPRVAQVPFTLPLRLLQIDRQEFDLTACIRRCFYDFDEKRLANTILVSSGRAVDFANHTAPKDWRTVDVLHLGRTATEPRGRSSLLQTEDPSELGTLGWTMRITEAWRARLVVMETKTEGDASRARTLAAALCARGGPSVLVGPSGWNENPRKDSHPFYADFYDALVHDSPVDQAFVRGLRDHPFATASQQGAGELSLFVGSGREELIRVSAPPEKLYNIAEALRSPDLRRVREAEGQLRFTVHKPGDSRARTSNRLRRSIKSLDSLHADWPSRSFDTSESGGFIPSASQIEHIRRTFQARAAETAPHRELRPIRKAGPRFANPFLWRAFAGGVLQDLDPMMARIAPRDSLVLGIQIGPRDTFVPVIEARALLEEPFKWQEGHKGVWLTIGLSGIDFDVLGEPVQQVWLPRSGATDVVEFSVTPRKSGAMMLRFCIYFGRSLLQSYRFAIWVGEEAVKPEEIRRALAGILGTTPEKVGDARYLGRLEYAAAPELVQPPREDDVALSIFANDIEGRRIVTVWTGEDLAVSTDNNISIIGQQIRSTLDEVSGTKYTGSKHRHYLYGNGEHGNAGTVEGFDDAMQKLAIPGWELYCSILNKDQRNKLNAGIDKPGGIVHVGQALLESVIPWATVYDRFYDPYKTVHDDGLPALHVTCTARLAASEGGGLPATCGQHPDCPLSPGRLAAQRRAGKLADEDTVVCPRHFWGFRYRIELPLMQVAEDGKPVPPKTEIAAANPTSVVIGFNASLGSATSHLTELEAAFAGCSVKATISGQSASRDTLMKLFKSKNIDLLYFFCHARGGQADPTIPSPRLEFQELGKPPGYIGWAQLDKFVWDHAPLVFLNGCNTAIFSPDALSPFIRKVGECGAAGAVGTEIPVFEQLAATFAKSFLGRFLNRNTTAGQALLDTRLEFLMQNNPLGLAYTLYAFSKLAMVPQSP